MCPSIRRTLLLCILVSVASGILQPQQMPVAQAQRPNRVFLPSIHHGARLAQAKPSSEQLIDKALQAGTITRDTAALYKAFAAFEDARLPAAYRGDDSGVRQSRMMRRIAEERAALTPATQQQLGPFFLPPSAPGSWLELREQERRTALATTEAGIIWRTVGAVDSPVKVWYQARFAANDAARAEEVFAIANTIVWPELKELLEREPISDILQRNNGADGRYDIYLVPTSSKTNAYVGCDNTPAYTLLDRTETGKATVIELLTYGFLLSYSGAEACSEYDWLMDATAIWAVDYIDADDNSEQQFADDYLDDTDGSLDEKGLLAPLNSALNQPMLGRYLWPFYLARKLGQPSLIRTIWENTEEADSLAAINSAIPGGFARQWPAFALAHWNRAPINTYVQADSLLAAPTLTVDTVANLSASGQWVSTMNSNDIPHLGMKYYRYTFPDDVSGVTFLNGWTYDVQVGPEGFHTFKAAPEASRKGATIQALVKLNGVWQTAQDWTELPLRFFCRDKRAQRIDELVLIVSNSAWEDRSYVLEPSRKAPLVAASNVGCHKWEGTITSKRTSAYKEYPGFSNTTIVANVTFEVAPMPQDAAPELQLFAAYSFNAAGRIAFEESYERYADMPPVLECGGKVTSTEALSEGILHIGAASFPDSPLGRVYNGEGTTFMDFTLPACEDGNQQNVEVVFLRMPEGRALSVKPNGKLIEGSWQPVALCDEWETCSASYAWTLIARREP